MKIELLKDVRTMSSFEELIGKHLKQDCIKLDENDADCEMQGADLTEECEPCKAFRRLNSAYYR